MAELNKLYPSNNFINVTPSDTTDLPQTTRGILIEVGGALSLHNEAGSAVVISGLAQGIIHPLATNRILATNTIASGIVAFF